MAETNQTTTEPNSPPRLIARFRAVEVLRPGRRSKFTDAELAGLVERHPEDFQDLVEDLEKRASAFAMAERAMQVATDKTLTPEADRLLRDFAAAQRAGSSSHGAV